MLRTLQNWENFECICSVHKVFPKFTELGKPWSKPLVHSECAAPAHVQYIVLVHFEFFWLGTLWSHHWENWKINSEWATRENHRYFLWENSRCARGLPNQNTLVTWPGKLWMYWPFSAPGKPKKNWMGKFWMYLWCTGLVWGWYTVHLHAVYLRCTGSEHWDLSPVYSHKPRPLHSRLNNPAPITGPIHAKRTPIEAECSLYYSIR